jgi:hypothetical protein
MGVFLSRSQANRAMIRHHKRFAFLQKCVYASYTPNLQQFLSRYAEALSESNRMQPHLSEPKEI